ncbi:RNA polymerase I associated factor A49-like protein [Dacryopinax primogenitus]|uniref:RNA polymerase I associated factor A49-like protein n=1 Tax=Dacryopinax primogenitus (strain DJM 731) TaxID=1858805 RepID=M5FPL8_DACPD|nr:RNA polymerase I associated factor A49-like protein [Dacryopinax primogenitus]EJT97158.1 RNA polymerase I associated factor A49-like protein [Dacryopinax primogenitus]
MVSVVNANSSTHSRGAIVGSFPALVPASSTTFKCYHEPASHESRAVAASSEKSILFGRSTEIDFLSVNQDAAAINSGSFSEYMVAVYDQPANKLVIQPAPLYIMSREVKQKQVSTIDRSIGRRVQARNALGQTFGSKRSKAAIQAAERNRVDVAAMKGIAHHLQEDIRMNTRALPNISEQEAIYHNRPGPSPNMEANDPAGVYSINSVVPDSELKACPTRELVAAQSNDERTNILPYNRSTWINQRLILAGQESKISKLHLRLLFHISCMLCFRQATMNGGDMDKMNGRMSRIPSLVQEGLRARYSEPSRLSKTSRVTSEMDVKLLAHMFVLCLIVDNFAADVGTLASDLHLPPARVMKIFRAIGCKVEIPNVDDRTRLGLPKEAHLARRAFLRVPLDFPKPRRGRTQRA